jgi:hypothetical protein
MTADERLRAADPLLALRDEIDVDAPPPEAVLEAIVATPRRRRRVPRRAPLLVAAGLVAAAVVVVALAVPGGGQPDIAARAYAAMAPTTSILHVVEIARSWSVSPRRPYWGGGEPPRYAWCCGRRFDNSRRESWQRGKETHSIIRTRSNPGRVQVSEIFVSKDDVVRSVSPNGMVRTMRPSRRILRDLRRDFVTAFRARYENGDLRDTGAATFNGKPARRYLVQRPARRLPTKLTRLPYVVTRASLEEYFLDPDTGLPRGSIVRDVTRRPDGSVLAESRYTTTVARIDRLKPTPANLAKLRFSRP